MTITTPSRAERRPAGRGGFTLVEVLISAGLSGVILVGVLSCFLMLGRSGANLVNYTDMEAEARTGLELFAEDTRMATDVIWNSLDSVTLVVPVSGGYVRYTYAYNSTAKTFTRQLVSPSTGTVDNLITGITSFDFKAYRINASAIDLDALAGAGTLSNANADTKQLQISLNASRTSTTVATATNTVLSARFILRNKRITS